MVIIIPFGLKNVDPDLELRKIIANSKHANS